MSHVYELPLATWISMALHRNNLAKLTTAIRDDKSLLREDIAHTSANSAYINKILREEVIKQFSDSRRPMLEVILNAVDAKPPEFQGNYTIRVGVGRRNFTSADDGSGMGLEDILQFLIIPFHTKKEGIEEIGRFGVGFLSCLNYCLLKPGRAYVGMNTRNGTEGYNLGFYAENNDVKTLHMALQKGRLRNPSGTVITIRKTPTVRKRALREYLHSNVNGIPPYRARIYINRELANDDSKQRWYTHLVELHLGEKIITQEAGIKIHTEGIVQSCINITSQGVLVRQVQGGVGYNSIISFPAGVQVVEGRDEFKRDTNYNRAVDAVFKALESLIYGEKERISKIKKEEERAAALKQLTPSIVAYIPELLAALGRQKITEIPNLDSLREALLPQKEYVLIRDDLRTLRQFFGEWVEDVAFDASFGGHSYWKDVYRGAPQLIREKALVVDSLSPEQFKEKVRQDASYYPNALVVAERLKSERYGHVNIVNVSPYGRSGLMFYNKTLFINAQHPHVSGAYDPSKTYALTADFCELPEVRRHNHWSSDEQVEEEIQNLTRKLLTREAWEEKRAHPHRLSW